jgi:hypothetical protein
VDEHDPLPPVVAEYQLAKLFGWTPAQIAEAPAVTCDWFLALAKAERDAGGR